MGQAHQEEGLGRRTAPFLSKGDDSQESPEAPAPGQPQQPVAPGEQPPPNPSDPDDPTPDVPGQPDTDDPTPEVDEFGNPVEDQGDSIPMSTKPRQEPAGSRPAEMDPMETAMMANPMLMALDPMMGQDPMLQGQGGPGGPPVEAGAPEGGPDAPPTAESGGGSGPPKTSSHIAKATNADTHKFSDNSYGRTCDACGMDAPEDDDDWVPSCQTVREGFGDHLGAKSHIPGGADMLDDEDGEEGFATSNRDHGGANTNHQPPSKVSMILRMIAYVQEANPALGDDAAYDIALEALGGYFNPSGYAMGPRVPDGPLTGWVKNKVNQVNPMNKGIGGGKGGGTPGEPDETEPEGGGPAGAVQDITKVAPEVIEGAALL